MDRTPVLMRKLRQQPLVRRFLERALPKIAKRFGPIRVWLFGSRVRGDWLHDSDLDVIVVSPAFREIHWMDRFTQVRLAMKEPGAYEVLCYTPEEFARKRREIGIVAEGVRRGVKVA